MYPLLRKKSVSRLATILQKILPSTLSNEMILNWLMVLESSLGIHTPSALASSRFDLKDPLNLV